MKHDATEAKLDDGAKRGMLITPARFRVILDQTVQRLRDLTQSKGEEYKQSSVDQLSNFKRGAQRQDVHPLVIWRVYFDKHLDSIMAWINDMRHGIYARPYSEPITGRIDDAILYLILLKGFYYQENPSKEIEFFAGCGRPEDNKLEIEGRIKTDARQWTKDHLDQHPPTRRELIMDAILTERDHQDKKYGPILHPVNEVASVQGPGGHEVGAWLVILEKELEEAKDAMVHGGNHATGRHTVRSELIQCAAVCFAALEQHGLEE